MKTSFARCLACSLTLLASSAVVHAHPGHDDHELTWDLSHLAAHPLATIGCVAAIIGTAAMCWYLIRRRTKSASTGANV